MLRTVWEHLIVGNNFPDTEGSKKDDNFKWFFEPMLSGPIVLSEPYVKMNLVDAAARIGCNVAGGEMEGYGMYHFCKNNKMPCVIIKGICDWGESKNGWEDILDELETYDEERNKYSNDLVKDCIQAMATEHAFRVMKYLLSKTESVLPPTNGGEKKYILNGESSSSVEKHIVSYLKKDRGFLAIVILCIAITAAWIFLWPYIRIYYEAPPGTMVFFVILFCGIMVVVARALYLKRKEDLYSPKMEGVGTPYVEAAAIDFSDYYCALSTTSSFARMMEVNENDSDVERAVQLTAVWQNRRKNMQCAYNEYIMFIDSAKTFIMDFRATDDKQKYKINPIQADTLQIMYHMFGCGFFHVIRKLPVKGLYREYIFQETVNGYRMMCRKQYALRGC